MKSKKALRIRESLIREYIREMLVEAGKRPTFAGVARDITAARPDLFKAMSKPGQVRVGPKTQEKSAVIKNMTHDELKAVLKDAGYETVDIYSTSDRKNIYSGMFDAFLVHPIDNVESIVPVVFSYSGSTPVSIQNEISFADSINAYASEETPITVKVGESLVLDNVTKASQVGSKKVQGQTSKADVVVVSCDQGCRDVGISLKLPSADYWLSGDKLLRDDFGWIAEELTLKMPPETRIEFPSDEDWDAGKRKFTMMSGDKKLSRIWFEIPENLQDLAVFGSRDNRADVVAEGNFVKSPIWDAKTRTMTWPNVKVYQSVEEMSDYDKPVGVFRTAEGRRGFKYGGIVYPGIRVTIARKGFARRGASAEIDAF